MGGCQIDFTGSRVSHHQRGSADGAAGADHVVKDQRDATLDLAADDVGLFRLLRAAASLVDNGQGAAEPDHVGQGPLDATFVRADNDQLVVTEIHQLDMVVNDRSCVKMVYGNVEKPLDLRGVQVHGQYATGACPSNHVRHELGRDGHAAFVFAILASIAEIGHDRGNSVGAGPHATVDHDQQFHEVVIDWWAGRLDDEHVAAADIFVDLT